MKQFMTVLGFEFGNYRKSKIFIGITVAVVLVIGILLSFPRITALLASKAPPEQAQTALAPLPVVNQSGLPDADVMQALASLVGYEPFLASQNETELRSAVEDGEYQAALILEEPLSYVYIVKTMSLYDSGTMEIDEALLLMHRQGALTDLGMSEEEAQAVMSAPVRSRIEQTGKSQIDNFFYTYILIFLLYMAIMLYGQFVAMGVASEKGSRTMELLITSARPTALMFGKIIGAGLAGLAQMTAFIGSAFVFFNLNRTYWQDNAIIRSIFDMPLSIMLYCLLFFVLGYFIYAFLYGALGSLASRTEDINTSVMPVTFLFIALFFVVVFSMTSGSIDSGLMRFCSFFPFSSPMAMFVRIAMGEVALWEIVASVVILLASTAGLGILSARIYRIGVLLYGKPPRLHEIFRLLLQKS